VRLSLLRIIAKGLLPAAVMVIAAYQILHVFDGTLARLALGVGAYIISVLLSVGLLAQETYGRLYLYAISRLGSKPDA
jgi:hypothetical protein